MSDSMLERLTADGFWLGGLGLAAFLSLFWVLRGAPVGQSVAEDSEDDAPRGNFRDRVIAAVTLGLLLILAGGYLAATRGVAWSIPAFGLGFGTVLTLILINQKHRHTSPALRRTLDLSSAILNGVLFAGVLLVINVIAFRYGGRAMDLTRERSYSLSSQSANVVKGLTRPVTFTTFYGKSNQALSQADRVQQLLELYRAANPEKVRLSSVDPFRDLPRFEELVKRAPEVEVTQGGGVVVELGEDGATERAVVRNADLFEVSGGRFDPDVDRNEFTFKGEDAITSTLMRLEEGKKSLVIFVTGHGEPSLDEMTAQPPGLGIWKSRLEATGSEVRGINLLTDAIPEDASLVVICGAKTPFQPQEIERLRQYSERKGAVLLVGGGPNSGLDDFLKGFDLAAEQGFVVDPALSIPGRVDQVVIPVPRSRHPILESMTNEPVMFWQASPLKVGGVAEAGTQATAHVPTTLLQTSRASWVEPDLGVKKAERDPGDPAGPVTVAVAITDRAAPGSTEAPRPRLVVFSSRYVADNIAVMNVPANLDLLMNSVNWLRGRAEFQGISPKKNVSLRLTADPVLRTRLVMVPTVMAILLIITLGVTTYLFRRA